MVGEPLLGQTMILHIESQQGLEECPKHISQPLKVRA